MWCDVWCGVMCDKFYVPVQCGTEEPERVDGCESWWTCNGSQWGEGGLGLLVPDTSLGSRPVPASVASVKLGMRLLAIIVLVLATKSSQCLRIKQTQIGRLDISRFPHFEELEKNMKKRSGYIDISQYTAGLEDSRISEHLTDLPDELQQLQQQLLEVSQ